jgi:hypothetical protein
MASTKHAATVPEQPAHKIIAADCGWRLFTASTQAGQHVQEHTRLEQNRCKKGADMASGSKDGPSLRWEGADLPRVSPGDYQAVCVGWQGPEWVLEYRRWSLRLEFSLLAEGIPVSAFFNFGSDSTEPHPQGRRSKFYRAWCIANGEAPRKGQQVTLSTFTEAGLLYLVRMADCLKDGKGADKPDALVYSRVTEIRRSRGNEDES